MLNELRRQGAFTRLCGGLGMTMKIVAKELKKPHTTRFCRGF
jgi:hypothetical protein